MFNSRAAVVYDRKSPNLSNIPMIVLLVMRWYFAGKASGWANLFPQEQAYLRFRRSIAAFLTERRSRLYPLTAVIVYFVRTLPFFFCSISILFINTFYVYILQSE